MAEVAEFPPVISHRHPVSYGELSQFIKDKIAETDLTVHELMELQIIEERISNLHLMDLSDIEVTMDDVEWPKI